MKLLLHVCCGPCAVYPVDIFKKEGTEIHGVFFNPNIHPYMEYKARLDAAHDFCRQQEIPLEELCGYGLEEFLKKAVFSNNRCNECYSTRLETIALEAKHKGFDAFSTTLLVSPYQKHELLKEVGEKAGEKYGVKFLYRDFRPGFREGRQKAREIGLYMQKYCGCIYSEKERYLG